MGCDTDARPGLERSRISPNCAVAHRRDAALANFGKCPMPNIEFFVSNQSKLVKLSVSLY